jgi:hypothetical protein
VANGESLTQATLNAAGMDILIVAEEAVGGLIDDYLDDVVDGGHERTQRSRANKQREGLRNSHEIEDILEDLHGHENENLNEGKKKE